MSDPVPFLSGIAGLADAYDGYIVDLWGVVHNGERPYPGVVDALTRLRARGRRVCLLSNAPRRVASVTRRLAEIGVPPAAYDQALSSGELTYEALRDRPDPFHRALGRRFLHIGPPRDNDVYEGLDLIRVDRPADAEFVINTGVDDFDETVEDYSGVLQAAAVRDLPMICANPDLVVVAGQRLVICAGALAAHYQTLGGRVAYHGKPYERVYDRCVALLGAARARVLAIGDSFRTDIAGANAAGLDSLLVAGGIHADELGIGPDRLPDPDRLAAMIAASGQRPTAVIPELRW